MEYVEGRYYRNIKNSSINELDSIHFSEDGQIEGFSIVAISQEDDGEFENVDFHFYTKSHFDADYEEVYTDEDFICDECGTELSKNDEYHIKWKTCNSYCYGKMVGVYC